MSHSTVVDNDSPGSNPTVWGQLTIINYATGGETVPITDVPQAAKIDLFQLGLVHPSNNSLGVVLLPLSNPSTGAIQLYQLVSGVWTEIPTTTALNAKITVVFHISVWS